MDINVWSDEVAQRLLTPGAYEELAQQDNAPVISIDDVCDCCYFQDGQPVGLFSLEAIQQAQRPGNDE